VALPEDALDRFTSGRYDESFITPAIFLARPEIGCENRQGKLAKQDQEE
jgi:hypothetical protein